MKQFFGKYRAKVANNVDPQKLGRIQVEVPSVLGANRSSWAMPSLPYAGPQVGFFAIPPIAANVWVEFEGGNLEYPIWTGCFWGNPADVPVEATSPDVQFLKTSGITMMMNNVSGDGGFTLKVDSPAVSKPLIIQLDKEGISFENSSIKLKLDASGIQLLNGGQSVKVTDANVSINDGALEVV